MARVIHKKPNIAAVARLAGVAQSSVSRVLNGGYASADVRKRVNRAIRKLDYARSTAAVNFASGRAGCFGIVLENTQGEWVAQLLSGIEQELSGTRMSLLIGSLVLNDAYSSATVQAWIDERRVDGLIFVRPGKAERPLVAGARRKGLAVSLIAPDERFPSCKVLRSNNRGAGHQIAAHLLGLGHRRVAFIGGPEVSFDTQQRLLGLRDGLAVAGVRLAASSVRFAAHYSVEEGRRFARAWLEQPRNRAPTAVVLGNDAMAIGFMTCLQQSGVRVPDSVSVVGFDDIPAATWVHPTLTTARQQSRELAAGACRSLMHQMHAAPDEDYAPVELPMSLVVRESTGTAGRR
jgi:LacI family transcriptional regulator